MTGRAKAKQRANNAYFFVCSLDLKMELTTNLDFAECLNKPTQNNVGRSSCPLISPHVQTNYKAIPMAPCYNNV